MITLNKIEIEGFKSYRKKFDFSFKKNGIWKIYGKNGAGKTNLIEAIGWCVYGKTFKNLKVDQIVNWDAQKNGTKVKLSFEDIQNKYTITRYRKHKQNGNKCFFAINDNLVDAAIVQQSIEETIGLTWDEFTSTVLYSAEDFKSFIEQTPKERLDFLEHLFKLDKFDSAINNAIDKKRELKHTLDILQTEVSEKEKFFFALKEKYNILLNKQKVFNLQTEHEKTNILLKISKFEKIDITAETKKIKEKELLLAAMQKTKNSISEITNILALESQKRFSSKSNYEEKLNELSNAFYQETTSLNAIQNAKKADQARLNNQAANYTDEQLRLKKASEDLTSKINLIQSELAKLEQKKCPTCGSVLHDDTTNNIISQRMFQQNALYDQLKENINRVKELSKLIRQTKKELEAIETNENIEQISKINKKINTISAKQQKIKDEIILCLKPTAIELSNSEVLNNLKESTKEIEFKISKLGYIYSLEELSSFQTNIKLLEEKLNNLKETINPFDSAASEISEQIMDMEKQIKQVSNKITKNKILFQHVKYILEILKVKIKISILQRAVKLFNENLKFYLMNLFPAINLSFDNDLNSIVLLDGTRVDNPKSLSTGQRARINFAACMALYQTLTITRGLKFSMVFFDEVLDFGLDTNGQQIVFDILRNLSRTVYIVSHRDTNAENFDGIIEIS